MGVAVAQTLGADPLHLLEEALESAGFWKSIEETRSQSRLRRERFKILINPDLDFFDPLVPGGTDPALVERLIDLLHDRGYQAIAVGVGRSEPDGWLHNRDPLFLPDLAGYRFKTDNGRSYDFVELARELSEPVGADTQSFVLISTEWQKANYRINFAKNKTHEELAFSLCVRNLVKLGAKKSTEGKSNARLCPEDYVEILRHAAPHFNIIDAFTSCHGGSGQRAPRSIDTHTFIASTDALLADWAGAAKMGMDPYASPVNDKALQLIGLPNRYSIDGDLKPYALWNNVHPLVTHSAQIRYRDESIGRLVEPWFQSVNREYFPFKDFYNDRINSFIAPLMAQVDENPRSFWVVVLLNYIVAWIGVAILSQRTMFSKEKLQQLSLPLQIKLENFDRVDYESIPEYLHPYEQLLKDTPPNRSGLRWRHAGDSVIFSCSHTFPISYKDFVAKVDVAQSIQYMNDYMGGSTVVVRQDKQQRVVQQAERNLYLQQPNWLILFGGQVIDVEKLEYIEYRRDKRVIYWRTVGSPNDSAVYDDGSVSFCRADPGQTIVRIFARQRFSLPILFRLFDINLVPRIRDSIIERAYESFFAGTVNNLHAAYKGRDYRIGQQSVEAAVSSAQRPQDLARYVATGVAVFAELLRHRSNEIEFGEWVFRPKSPAATKPAPMDVGKDGFRHFGPSPPGTRYTKSGSNNAAMLDRGFAVAKDVPDFVSGLLEAVMKDLDRMVSGTGESR